MLYSLIGRYNIIKYTVNALYNLRARINSSEGRLRRVPSESRSLFRARRNRYSKRHCNQYDMLISLIAVNDALKDVMAKIHAVTMKTWTPKQYEERKSTVQGNHKTF